MLAGFGNILINTAFVSFLLKVSLFCNAFFSSTARLWLSAPVPAGLLENPHVGMHVKLSLGFLYSVCLISISMMFVEIDGQERIILNMFRDGYGLVRPHSGSVDPLGFIP